jgi:hypothetical protein
LANKGILYAKIRIGDSYLAVFNTHLQASYFGSPEYLWNISVKTRIDHIDELANFIKEIIHENNWNSNEEDIKIMVVGDFNVDAHNYETKKKVKIIL